MRNTIIATTKRITAPYFKTMKLFLIDSLDFDSSKIQIAIFNKNKKDTNEKRKGRIIKNAFGILLKMLINKIIKRLNEISFALLK